MKKDSIEKLINQNCVIIQPIRAIVKRIPVSVSYTNVLDAIIKLDRECDCTCDTKSFINRANIVGYFAAAPELAENNKEVIHYGFSICNENDYYQNKFNKDQAKRYAVMRALNSKCTYIDFNRKLCQTHYYNRIVTSDRFENIMYIWTLPLVDQIEYFVDRVARYYKEEQKG